MDPFVVISFGKKVFRTRVIRHCLNPVWDEKLIFHVRRYESNFKVQLSVLDWDKLSSNDLIAEAGLDVAKLLENIPEKDEETGLYPENSTSGNDLQKFELQLSTGKESAWEMKHSPVLTIKSVVVSKAKVVPSDMHFISEQSFNLTMLFANSSGGKC